MTCSWVSDDNSIFPGPGANDQSSRTVHKDVGPKK
jgi:hypothetical protein